MGKRAFFSTSTLLSRQHFCHCLVTYSLKPDSSVDQCSKLQRMSHRTALSDFKILFSKTRNRKFYHTGICYEGERLVAVIKSVLRQSNNGWQSTNSYGFWRVISFDVTTACCLNIKRNNCCRWSHEKWFITEGHHVRTLTSKQRLTFNYILWWLISFVVTTACCLKIKWNKFGRRSHEKWFITDGHHVRYSDNKTATNIQLSLTD